MRPVTGIELGVDSCVLARVRPAADAVRVSAVHGSFAPDWDDSRSLTENLRTARRAARLPRRASVVAWGLHESASASEPLTRAALAPLREAGFAVEAVLAPAEALCLLAERRVKVPGRAGEAWLALNRQGVALAIVEGGRLLYRRAFDWNYRPGTTPREELLQRYSLVAHLAPEVRHGIDVVRAEHGAVVNAIVTCGDLPDLRSLTMPLIEELDIEVETLDTLEGIHLDGAAAADAVVERAPELRLACAAAMAGATARRAEPLRLAVAAALLIVVLLGAWMLGRYFNTLHPVGSTGSVSSGSTSSATPASRRGGTTQATVPAATTGRGEAPAEPSGGLAPAESRVAPRSAAATAATRAGGPASASTGSGNRRSGDARNVPPAPSRTPQTPLRDPLPVVNSILVSPERRLAVADGEIVREGERIGRRVLLRIEPGALVLREPSGLEVRVAIRRKLN